MATIDDDLAKSVTEGFRQAQIDIVNQDLILSGTGDVTVTLADGSKKTGPSWSKLIAAATAAGTSAAAAKTSETNALASKNAAATSATNAATSEGNALASKNAAKTSETNAKTSETNAKTSENNAAASASSAASSLAAAQQLTSVPYEDAPYPDVWAPLNDDLRLLAGFAPYDTLTISGQVLELPTKSLTFTRASTATYIDKSGVLRTAAINEPRFEKEGLLVEGQSTNQVLNSEDPTKWAMTGGMTTSVITDGTAQAITLQASPTVLAPEQSFASSATLALAVGDTLTLSCRFKGTDARFRFRFLLEGAVFGDVSFDCISGEIASQPTAGITATTTLAGGDGYTYATATLTVTTAGNYIGQFRSYYKAGALGNNIPLGTTFYLQTVQAEKNAVATSYIPTGAAAVTRAADSVTLQASGNCGLRLTSDLIKRSVSFELTVNSCGLTSGNLDILETYGAAYDKILRLSIAGSYALATYRSGTLTAISGAYPFYRKTVAHTLDGNAVAIYFDGKSNRRDAAPYSPTSAAQYLKISSSSAVVYHIRNLRIWHRVLTLNQINGLR
ncbi:phage head spike fiber domain-containing protein [Leclercia adecarboxylata]|uniref:phage head spike fiber domain-containing protein n=1 Tax=Leclercia adecarboxylata TaxID=83655 RepID=UPI001F32C485|nr:hypothetical protein [Leclercia adecarboxylata]MCE9979699.1 hypothetical protein [Leclercia adecarboxylata]